MSVQIHKYEGAAEFPLHRTEASQNLDLAAMIRLCLIWNTWAQL